MKSPKKFKLTDSVISLGFIMTLGGMVIFGNLACLIQDKKEPNIFEILLGAAAGLTLTAKAKQDEIWPSKED